jgi:hypothetical protein
MNQTVLEDGQEMNSLHPDSVEAATLYQMARDMSDKGNHDLAREILNIADTLG